MSGALVARDDFHGAGGWSEGLHLAAAARGVTVDSTGVEYDRYATATARAAGHRVLQMDVRHLPPLALGRLDLYIASPPCQTWSPAGKGAGRAALPSVLAALDLVADGASPADAVAAVHDDGLDERTVLALHPLVVIRDAKPTAVALEQVRTVRPVWAAYAEILRRWGYSVATDVVTSEQYGVPQTRARAVLVAHRERKVTLPAPTHTRYVKGAPRQTDGLLPWVSMADALGADYVGHSVRSNYGTGGDPAKRGERDATEPAATVTSKVDRNLWQFAGAGRTAINTAGQIRRDPDEPAHTITGKGTAAWVPTAAVPGDTAWTSERPSPTIVGSFSPDVVAAPGWRKAGDGPRQSQPGSVRVTLQEAAVLQSFRPDYPWQGPRTAQFLQVGNAIPPLLAAALLGEVL